MAEGSSVTPLDAAADRIRETAKWLTVAFAAIGAIMIAGSQLSSIGSLELWTSRFWWSVVGGALAAAGALAALVATAWALTAPAITLRSLAERAPKGADNAVKDDTLLQGYQNPKDLADTYAKALRKRKSTLDAHHAHLEDPALADKARAADARVVQLHGVGQGLVTVASYQQLSHRWKVAVRWIVGGGLAAAVGLGLFAWASNPPAEATASAAAPNVVGTAETKAVTLTQGGVEALATKLGSGCNTAAPLAVVVLGETSAGPDVLIDQVGCARLRVVMTQAWGTVH